MALVDTRAKCTLIHGNPQKFSGFLSAINGTVNFWGVVWSSKMHFVPEAMIDKVQDYPIPNNMKEVQASEGILGV